MSRTHRRNWTDNHIPNPKYATKKALQHRDGACPREIHIDPVGGYAEIWDPKNKKRAKRRRAKFMRRLQQV